MLINRVRNCITVGLIINIKSIAMTDNWGQLGHLSEQQKEALEKFNNSVNATELEIAKFSVESFDQAATRFLRARQFDVQKAHDLLHTCYETLKERKASSFANMDPEEILGCEASVLKKFYPHHQAGYDKYNRPLLYDNSGNVNMHAVQHVVSQEQLIGYHFWTMERMLDDVFKAGVQRKQAQQTSNSTAPATSDSNEQIPSTDDLNMISTCCILDLNGISIGTITQSHLINHMKLLIQIDNVCYPEMLGKFFIVNAPGFIVSTFDMVKGNDKKQWH